ncbi:TVP38/TMEM64 family protein [Pseudoalteromonas luteoviolacea]|uniref:TVP38/TMEM64 family protein n=1 Tax=Pseudoalteromonas luteoviolacea TaxID=43657 RepID=UPI001151A6A6|nr:VTT domain-containing protein [Pseudoalteromonas luteoviolacea]TQF70796.1 VTT domain-containing protein [Pseudoalteromonas luteoviolacea]
MKSILKLMLVLACFFASTFIVLKLTGILSIEAIESWLQFAQSLNTFLVALVVITLLFLDLFVAVPTLTLVLLAGYFLGPLAGSFSAIIGMLLAGLAGYWISFYFGDVLLNKLLKTQTERASAVSTFKARGPVIILLSRASPILPEVSACMAGLTKMPFKAFIFYWLLSIVPYAIIAAYAGSASTLENPKPAIYAAIGLTGFFWTSWWIFRRTTSKKIKTLSM